MRCGIGGGSREASGRGSQLIEANGARGWLVEVSLISQKRWGGGGGRLN